MESSQEWTIDASRWSQYWKHRNLAILDHAPKNLFEKAPKGRAFSDWNRQIEAGNLCVYHINGKKISDFRMQKETNAEGKEVVTYKPFRSQEEFEHFLCDQLFSNFSQEDQKKMVAMVLEFGYQAGLLHATSSAVSQMLAESTGGQKALKQPTMHINLLTNENGLNIVETNEYKTWQEGRKTHTCTAEKPYYVKTETTYLMQPDKIVLSDLIVDCPSKHLASILDQRPAGEQIYRFPLLRELIARIIQSLFSVSPFDENKPEGKVLFTPE